MSKGKSNFFPILLLLGAGVFLALYFYSPQPKINPPKRISASSPQAQALVNKHLWITSQTQELAEKKMAVENYRTLQIGDSIWPQGNVKKKDVGVDHSPDRNETNAYEDLNRYRKEFRNNTPDHQIQGQIADENRMKEYTDEYRAEYARQFIENARRNGYAVQLNSDYVVISVTRIPGAAEREPSATYEPSRPQAQ